MRHVRWWLFGMAVLPLSVMICMMLPLAAHAATRDGAFTIKLTGQVGSAQPKAPDSSGTHTTTISEQMQTNAGQFPNVDLQLDLVEVIAKNKSGRLSGTAMILDQTGQTPLFSATVSGTIAVNGVVTYSLAQAQTATGNGGTLVWMGNYAATPQGALNGAATGTLVLPTGLPSGVANSVWPGTTTQSSANNSDPTLWYVTRGAALAAYLVLVAATALGMGISTQAFDSVTQRWRVLDLHQVLTLLLLGLIALHLVTLVLDPFLPFDLGQLLVPFVTPYRSLAVAGGILGLYSLVIVTLSSYVRRWMSYGLWRALHYLSAITFVAVTLHGIFTGADTPTPWMIAVYVTSSVLIVALLVLRIVQTVVRRGNKLTVAPARQ